MLIIVLLVISCLGINNVFCIPQDEQDENPQRTPRPVDSKTELQLLESSEEINLFGYDLFRRNYKELSISNVFFPGRYLLGPGDKLGIFLSGKIRQEFEVIVNVEGKIYIPTVGALTIHGMRLDELKSFLNKKFLKFYDNFHVNIMLMEPKPVQVAVVGEVNQPGKYSLTALNTVVDAMIFAGGPTQKGSLRNIQLYRKGELVNTIDLYEFLMNPQYIDECFLELGDRIFVPLIEEKVASSGELKRSMEFELKPMANEKISDIIELAGGFTEYAYLAKIEISKLQTDGNRKVIYINYNDIANNYDHPSNIALKNGDNIHVFSKLDQVHERMIYIHGEVKKPGEYVLEDSLRLSDLILKAGNLKRNAYTLEAEIAKVDPSTPTKFITINLQKLLNDHDPNSDILLEDDDRVFIRQIPEWHVGPVIEIKGEVMFPGIYSITKDSTKLNEIIRKAGSFTDDALIREAKLIRKSSKITIDKEYERLKQISREKLSEAEYQYLVMRENTQDIGQIVVDFYNLFIKNDLSEDIVLDDGDIIIIPKKPNVVYVTGRVSKPGGVLYVPHKKMKYYLERAGGTSWDAHVKKTKVTKVSGEILDDEDVKEFSPGDIIWVPRKPDRNWWEIFRQTIAVATQLAAIYLIADQAMN